MSTLALFDLDNTLLGGDSDARWGEYLVEQGILDSATYGAANARFYQDYENGCLDPYAFLRFAFAVLKEHPLERLHAWREGYLAQKIEPIILPKGQALLDKHRRLGHTVVMITATNGFLTRAIADRMGVAHLIASEPELVNGRYTGELQGSPSFGPGKVTRWREWLANHGQSFDETWFYSDSHNDLPLLRAVDHPIAVDPDAILRVEAQRCAWPILTLRDPE